MDTLRGIERSWTERADHFDEDPDHGLDIPEVRTAWGSYLATWIPSAHQRIADLGCGTGSLSLLLAERQHSVVGIDLSARMIALAARKAAQAGLNLGFAVGEAGDPTLEPHAFDVILCRHVLWTLPDPQGALARWAQLLRPTGRLVAIEGRWFDPPTADDPSRVLPWDGGVRAADLIAALVPLFGSVEHVPLSDDEQLWGKSVTDERYAVVAINPQ